MVTPLLNGRSVGRMHEVIQGPQHHAQHLQELDADAACYVEIASYRVGALSLASMTMSYCHTNARALAAVTPSRCTSTCRQGLPLARLLEDHKSR